MFIIRDAQGEAFKQNEAKLLFQFILQKMMVEYPQHLEPLDEAERTRRLHLCIAKAKQYGFGARHHVYGLTVFMFEVTPTLEQHQELLNILENKDLMPEERLKQLNSDALASARALAIKKRHRKAWQHL